jgi:hypothetical protein
VEGFIVRKGRCVHIECVEIQRIEKEDECFDIEKREGSGGPRFQSPLEV